MNSKQLKELKATQRTQLILALDVDSFSKAKYFVDLLYPRVKIFKVGLQLFIACGRKIIRYIREKGGRIFLDLKFYDIPNTVANASREVLRLGGIEMFSVHTQGSLEMMQRAKETVQDEARKLKIKAPLIIGITVLTSEAQSSKITSLVISLTRKAKTAGLNGIVASVKEARRIRKVFGSDLVIVSPGIRFAGSQRNDQKRIATPEEAKRASSNYIVVGRPILEARDPLTVTKEIIRRLTRED